MQPHFTEIKPNFIDKVIGFFSPQKAYERMCYRYGFNAGGTPRRHEGWTPVGGSAEHINSTNRDILRRKARDLERNSDITSSIIEAYTRNVVGSGFIPQADTGDDALDREIEYVFKQWMKRENCDVTETQSFLELCNMTVRRLVIDGGIFFIKVHSEDKAIPFQLQAREVTDLEESFTRAHGKAGNHVFDGVEVNKYGKRIAYHIRNVSPDGWSTGDAMRIEAKRVIPLWQKNYPSQIREITPMCVAINRIEDNEDFIDTVSLKEKILACFAVFIKRQMPVMPGGGLGRNQRDAPTSLGKRSITPGVIQELQPGDDVQAVVPNGQASNAREMVGMLTRFVSAGQGLSYEAVSRDMSQVNYSSARQTMGEDKKTYQRMQRFLVEHFLDVVYEEVVIAAVTSGVLSIPDFWTHKEKYLNHSWTMPGWSWIDPVKEVNANKTAIESGQDTLAAVCASRGGDWQDTLRQRAKELKLQKELEQEFGISFEKGGEAYGTVDDNQGNKSDTTE